MNPTYKMKTPTELVNAICKLHNWQADMFHDARNALQIPENFGLLRNTALDMVVRLDTLHPSRRGIKRNACALDMATGAALAMAHANNKAAYNMFAHLAIMIATRGADELHEFTKVEKT